MYSHKGLSIRLFLGIEITIQLRYKDSYTIFPPFPLQTAHWSFPVPKALFIFKKIFIKQKKPCPDRSPDELANRDSMILLYWTVLGTLMDRHQLTESVAERPQHTAEFVFKH